MSELEPIVVLGGARTPIGSFGGSLAEVPAHELGATAVRGALDRAGVLADDIDEVVIGCVGQVGGDGLIARRVSVEAGLPYGVPSYSVNRQCGSGLQAIWSAALQLQATNTNLAIAGGAESMSRMPFYDFTPRGRKGLGNREIVDGTLKMLTDPFLNVSMGVTAENVAETYGISRQEQDEFALLSQQKAAAATAALAEEIVDVSVSGRRPRFVSTDEHPRPETTLEQLASLRPAFRDGGSVTPGNSSGINDGAAAVVLAKQSFAADTGLRPLARLEAVATAGNEPGLMGYAPVFALKRLFAQTGIDAADVDVFEVNEAFAAQAVAVIRDAHLDPEKVNPYGGAIALGHPVGATGATLSVRVVHDLVRRDLDLGVVTMCIGGGQAMAALFRRI